MNTMKLKKTSKKGLTWKKTKDQGLKCKQSKDDPEEETKVDNQLSKGIKPWKKQ